MLDVHRATGTTMIERPFAHDLMIAFLRPFLFRVALAWLLLFIFLLAANGT